MKTRRALYLSILLTLVILVGNSLHFGGTRSAYSDKYPSIVCPDVGGGANLQVSLNNSSTLVRSLSRKSINLVPAKKTVIQSSSGSILVEGNGVNSLAWISRSGNWGGGVLCLAPQSSQYLVGAASDVSSKSKLVLVNSGLSTSTADLTIWSDSQNPVKRPVTVAKNQTAAFSLVSLAPGLKSIGILVAPRSGRVSAYLADERGKGLQALGGDMVNSQSSLTKELYIPAMPHDLTNGKTHLLRVLNPNIVPANISVEVISTDGRYVPIGLDNRTIAAERVQDIPFDVTSKVSAFALKITSDQPIAASGYSRINRGRSDFVWSTAVLPGVRGVWAVTGLEPTLVISGGKIDVKVRAILPKGKRVERHFKGSDITAWKLPSNALAVEIKEIGRDNAAALIDNESSGSGYFPLLNGSALTRSSVPTANIGVLNP